MLSLLALRSGAELTTDQLIEGLWGDGPAPVGPQGGADLHRQSSPSASRRDDLDHLGRLPAPCRRRRCAALRGAHREEPSAGRRARDTAAAADALSEALALWRGPPLPDLSDHHPGAVEAVRLDELRRTAEEDLVELRLAAGGHGELVAGLEAAVAAEPLRERRWGQFMLALYRGGRQADALRAYQRVRRHLAEDLGLEPGSELAELEEAILAQDPRLGPGPDPVRTSLVTATTGAGASGAMGGRPLPVAANSFVGRDSECAAVSRACWLGPAS